MTRLLIFLCYLTNYFLFNCVLCSNNSNQTFISNNNNSTSDDNDDNKDLLVDNSQQIVVPVVYSVENRHLWQKPQPFGNSITQQVPPPTAIQFPNILPLRNHGGGTPIVLLNNNAAGIVPRQQLQQPQLQLQTEKILKRPVSFAYQIRTDQNSSPTLQYYGTKNYYDDLMRLRNHTKLLELTTVLPTKVYNTTDKIVSSETNDEEDEGEEDDEEEEEDEESEDEEEEKKNSKNNEERSSSNLDSVKSNENINGKESQKSPNQKNSASDEADEEDAEDDEDEEEAEENQYEEKNQKVTNRNSAEEDKESSPNENTERKLNINSKAPLDKNGKYIDHRDSHDHKKDKHLNIYTGHDGYKKLLESNPSKNINKKHKPVSKKFDDIDPDHLREYHGDNYPFKSTKKYHNHKYEDTDNDPEDKQYQHLLSKSKKNHEKIYKNNANKYYQLKEKVPTESRVQENIQSNKPRKSKRKPKYRIIRIYDDDEDDYDDEDLLDFQPDPVIEYKNHKLPISDPNPNPKNIKSKKPTNSFAQTKNHPKFKPLFNDAKNDQISIHSDKIPTKRIIILKPNQKNTHFTKPLAFKDDLNVQAESRPNAATIEKHVVAASSDHKAQASEHHKKKKHHQGPKKFKKGGGKEHKAEHHSHHGEKGEKGYKGYHKHEKGEKGHHDKEGHKGSYEDHGGHKKKHHHEEGHFGGHKKGEEGEKGAKYEEHGKHEKGHSTKGEHNIHKKDEYEKKHEFFDEYHEGGESEKHGGFHEEHEGHKGGSHKGGHHKSGYDHGEEGKKGKSEKGGHYDEDKGHKHEGGHESHHHHDEKHGKKEAKDSGKKYAYKKGKKR